jgi:hypothetical protein
MSNTPQGLHISDYGLFELLVPRFEKLLHSKDVPFTVDDLVDFGCCSLHDLIQQTQPAGLK